MYKRQPYDRLILDRRLRFAGDAVAIVAGRDEAVVDHAMRLIRVKYEVLEPVLDMLSLIHIYGSGGGRRQRREGGRPHSQTAF